MIPQVHFNSNGVAWESAEN